jgi:hypothetical protein
MSSSASLYPITASNTRAVLLLMCIGSYSLKFWAMKWLTPFILLWVNWARNFVRLGEDRDRGSIDLTGHDLAQFLPSEARGLEYTGGGDCSRRCAHNASINLRRSRHSAFWISNFLHVGPLAAAATLHSMSS